jgi:hypothetical protein
VDLVSTLWITLPPSGPAKRVSGVGLAVSAVAHFGCQKDSCFCSWTLWTTTLTLRVRCRPSGSAPVDPQGRRVGSECFPFLSTCFPFLSTGGQAKWREPNRRSFPGTIAQACCYLVADSKAVLTPVQIGVGPVAISYPANEKRLADDYCQ